MRPDVGPTACLSFEPDEARCLLWLPLAVRHKLDGCRLRLSLLEWQALPLETRAELLHLPAAAAGAWLAAATPFAHYVLSRRNRAKTWVAAGGVGLAAR